MSSFSEIHQMLHNHVQAIVEAPIEFINSRGPNSSVEERLYRSKYSNMSELDCVILSGTLERLNGKRIEGEPKDQSDGIYAHAHSVKRRECPLKKTSEMLRQKELFLDALLLVIECIDKPTATEDSDRRKAIIQAATDMDVIKKCHTCKYADFKSHQPEGIRKFRYCSLDETIVTPASRCEDYRAIAWFKSL